MNVAELLVRCLENEGVKHVFGIPGEETLALNAALAESDKISFILTRHEQGAAFMADVYGRLSSYPGVCLATLGPGATNLLTGVADAQLDRAPLVAITGQAGLERVHKESHQYIDVVRMLSPVTKWSTRISVADATPEVVRKAFRLARLEKPGATHIELPEDLAGQSVDMKPLEVRRTSYPNASENAIHRALEVIKQAKSPMILVGNGVARRQAAGHPTVEALRRFVRRSGVFATHTYMAKGVLDPFGSNSLPPVGLQRPGAELSNVPQLASADLVIAVGYDLVEWSPSLWNPKRDKSVVHIDSTAAELDFPDRKVVAFAGDGGFLMNVQELETAKRLGTAVVSVVLVDDRLGVIEANERRLFGRTFGTEFGNPGFVELARAFGIAGFAVATARDLFPTLRRALDLGEPAIVAVPWDHRANEQIAERLS